MANLDEFKVLLDKTSKFDNMKGRYVALAKRLQEAQSIIDEVMGELDPVAKVAARGQYKTAVEGIYNAMRENGREFTIDQIMDWENYTEQQARYIWQLLEKMEFVEKRSDATNSLKKVMYVHKKF